MRYLCDFLLDELVFWLKEKGESSFRAKQIFEWLYQKGVSDISEMSNLSKSLRELLSEYYPCLQLEKSINSEDSETTKYLWKLHDGYFVESVLICSGDRRTVCVSTQVGCPVKCSFCASGRNGFVRNLATAEIIEQVIHIKRLTGAATHVVFMGMGEPLDNFDNVVSAVRLLSCNEGLNISQRRITISTVGLVEQIEKLATTGLKINLALSLHAPNQQLRQRLIPYARKYALENIMKAVDQYAKSTKRDVTYEYILIKDVNDSVEDAKELAKLIGRRQATVNLIPCNPIKDIKFKRPSGDQVKAFGAILSQYGINNTCRYTKGKDIAAACGQLVPQPNGES